ncbi:MAG: M3 family oligoendopeptidase [Candidatus Baltobacteraceae bacterium]
MTFLDEIHARYDELDTQLSASPSASGSLKIVADWNTVRTRWETWAAKRRLAFSQNTADPAARTALAEYEQASPLVDEREVRVKRVLLSSPHRGLLESEYGSQAFALWKADIAAFEPAVIADSIRESELTREYKELIGGASIPFEGADRTLSAVMAFAQFPDRDLRTRAETARFEIFAQRKPQLDRIYDDLVRVRDRMARTLGFENFVDLGYHRMHRIDFGPQDVARYRDDIVEHIVPVVQTILAERKSALHLEELYYWDESALFPEHDVRPLGDQAWVLERFAESFEAMHPDLGAFARFMLGRGLLDVDGRANKAYGAFCTTFATERVPFVFANFNGSRADIKTLFHEMGHAYQSYASRDQRLFDYLTPTSESAEIDSMGMEFLAWPQMERFFGSNAQAYQREHLIDAFLFLPYGVCVDHFQHLVYENPAATPAERDTFWKTLEARYLPWRKYGRIGYLNEGSLWQEKRHIYLYPFYYIDYTLAQCCALQFWAKSQDDYPGTLDTYLALCKRGGEAPFGELIKSAGLRSPFEPGVLRDVADRAQVILGF